MRGWKRPCGSRWQRLGAAACQGMRRAPPARALLLQPSSSSSAVRGSNRSLLHLGGAEPPLGCSSCAGTLRVAGTVLQTALPCRGFFLPEPPIPCPCVTAAASAWVGTSWRRPLELVKHHLSVECYDLICRTQKDSAQAQFSSPTPPNFISTASITACVWMRGREAFQTSFSSFETANIEIKKTRISISVKRSASQSLRETPAPSRAPCGGSTGRVGAAAPLQPLARGL